MKQKPPSPPVLRALGLLGGLGFTFAIPTVLGTILGHYLDGLLNTGPGLTLFGLLLGLIVGLVGVIGLLKTVLKDGL